MTQKVPQKVLDKVGGRGQRTILFRPNLSGLQRENARHSVWQIVDIQLSVQRMNTKEKRVKDLVYKKIHKRNFHLHMFPYR